MSVIGKTGGGPKPSPLPFLSDKSPISIGLALTLIGGSASWMTAVYKQAEGNSEEIVMIKKKMNSIEDKVEEKNEKLNDKLDVMLKKLSHIEGRLETFHGK